MSFMDAANGGEFSVSDGRSRTQEKIEVAQQILTLLEDTMSSAKSAHQTKQSHCQSKIDMLEEQVRKLRQEMHTEEDDFKDASTSLEESIQNYLNVENKLITIEERSIEDYVVLPDICARTDIHVAHHMSHKYNDWQKLKFQCQTLNQTTENWFRDNVCERKYLITVSPNGEYDEKYKKALDKANALNLFRGKKLITRISHPTSRLVCLTWYKNEVTARDYVQSHYLQIIEHVIKEQYDEYKGWPITTTEVNNTHEHDTILGSEVKIHVQAKTSSIGSNIPRKITIYQFDEAVAHVPPTVRTFNLETAPTQVHKVHGQSDDTVCLISEQIPNPTPTACSLPGSTNRTVPSACVDYDAAVTTKPKQSPRKKSSQKIGSIDVLSLIGFNETPEKNVFPITEDSASTQPSTSTGCLNRPSTKTKAALDIKSSNTIDLRQSTLEASSCQVGGVRVNEWVMDYMREKGIQRLTDVQKQVIQCFKTAGDVLYEGVTNGGKTTGMAIGLLNCVDPENCKIQALIITPNVRSSKRVQKLTTFEGCQCLIYSKRVEELVDARDRSKLVERPSACQILVGTLSEMEEIVTKSILHKDDIRFLILHKTEEIFGSKLDVQKKVAYSLKKILYALNATTKVVVICRTMTEKCSEFEDFCKFKLRHKQILKEDMDMEELNNNNISNNNNNNNNRLRNLSGDYKASSVGSESDSSYVYSRKARDTSRADTYVTSTSVSYSSDVDLDNESLRSFETTTSVASSVGAIHNKEYDQSEWRTIIPKSAMQILGISVNVGNEIRKNPENPDRAVDHLYACIDNGEDEDYGKIEVISQLDLEEDRAIIFCGNTTRAEWISTKLRQKKLWPQVLHDDVSQKEQSVILQSYRQGICRVIICTDFMMSISLDAADVVLNFDLPKSELLYLNRAAFAARNIRKSKSADSSSNKTTKAVVVSLIIKESETLEAFERSLGITIHNCEDN